MFKDLLSNLEENGQKIREQLKSIQVECVSADGHIKISADASAVVRNIQIAPEYLVNADIEQLEDELVVLINKAIALAKQKEREAMAELLKNSLPPGMGDLPGMF
jgi:DNA-binding protein YbaB